MRLSTKVRACLLAPLGTLALAAASPGFAHVQSSAFDVLEAQELRLAEVGFRLARASGDSCPASRPLTGLVTHDLSEYDPGLRKDVSDHFGLTDGVGVMAVVPGSPAQFAGIHAGDEIIALDGRDLRERGSPSGQASFERMSTFERLLDQTLAAAPAVLTVRRGGRNIDLALSAASGCGGRFHLSLSHTLNAWSDGDYVVVSTAILDFSMTDDELAFVVAHEMSHNILERQQTHGGPPSSLFSAAESGKLSSKTLEIQADSYAVQLMAQAGYDPERAVPFLVRASKRRWWDFMTFDHPGTKRRIETIRSTWAKVQASRRLPKLDFTSAEARRSS